MRKSESASSGVTTLVELFQRSMERNKRDQLNYKVGGEWQAVSTFEIGETVRDLALGLDALEVGEGERVGLLSENRVEWIYADLAVVNIGAADVPIYPTHAPKQVSYILNDAGVKVLFISTQAQYERIREVLVECPTIGTIISFERLTGISAGEDGPRVLSLDQFRALGRSVHESDNARYEQLRGRVGPETVATLIYTSGTTGDPKGVMLTHANLTSNVLLNCRLGGVYEDEVSFSFLPFSHIFERNVIYIYLHAGASMHLATSVETVGTELIEVRPGFMTSVPRLYEKIYARALQKAEEGGAGLAAVARWSMRVGAKVARVEDRGEKPNLLLSLQHLIADRLVLSKWRGAMGGRIRAMVSGGAALAPDLCATFFGARLPIYQGYGLTETSPSISTNYPGCNRIGSVGRPIPGVEVRIAEDGEILCTGPNVMNGYYNKERETTEVLTKGEDGRVWFHTGDIGHLDGDGFLYITDRKKDLLKTSGGKYIAPQPMESAIKGSRFISQVVVIGDGRKFPAAIIIPNFEVLHNELAEMGLEGTGPAELILDRRVVSFFEGEVERHTGDFSQYEKIKAVMLLDRELTVDGGEMTPTLKVRRRIVNEKFQERIDQLYAEKEVGSE
jgi:long-chain acyl-CoA synthetase